MLEAYHALDIIRKLRGVLGSHSRNFIINFLHKVIYTEMQFLYEVYTCIIKNET